MANYSKSKIYMIEPCIEYDDGDIYIGSTIQRLSKRFSHHTSHYKSWINGISATNLSSYRLFEKYGVENCRIVLIEEYPCDNKEQLFQREAHYQRTMKCINKNISFTTYEEILQKKKLYREENKEKIDEYEKQRRTDTDRIEYMKNYSKTYHITNKKTIQENKKKHYEDNKDEINEKRRNTKIECECGLSIRKDGYKEHCNSKKHKQFILENSCKDY